MPMSTLIGSTTYYICPLCGNAFKDKQHAAECEAHCRAHRKPNPEHTAKSEKCPG